MSKKLSIPERLKALRHRMKREGMDAYIILTDDFHASEYVGDYFKCREYISGFTGSAGKVVVTSEKAGLWTDGRYFLQAAEQLKGSGITLYRMGEEGVPEIEGFFEEELPDNGNIGIDGRTISVREYRNLKDKLEKKGISFHLTKDLIGDIWIERPAISCKPVWELDEAYTGKSRIEKMGQLREKMKEKDVDMTVISSLDDIAWLLNVRGNDVACTPVVLSYLVVAEEQAYWYVQKSAVPNTLRVKMEQDGIQLEPYASIYEKLGQLVKDKTVYIDPNRLNVALYQKIENVLCEENIKEGENLTLLPKAIKNKTEVANIIEAHRKDGVACTRFIHWLKKHIKEEKITELSATEKLESFRAKQEHYIGPSFDTITGYGSNGAIVHYSATIETNKTMRPESFVLIDSGGHYLEGTTDITRTIALGSLTQEQKHHYTLVLRGNLNLAAARFKYGCSGINFDYLARAPLWEEGLDYNHGTGHGVGYLLNVHEAPNGFRYKATPDRDEYAVMEEGMVTSDEPGLYLSGEYGIRIENLMVCKKARKTEYGQFMEFKTLTLVPYERDAILPGEMTEEELELLNAYHKQVYDTLQNDLDQEEREWLAQVTAPIYK